MVRYLAYVLAGVAATGTTVGCGGGGDAGSGESADASAGDVSTFDGAADSSRGTLVVVADAGFLAAASEPCAAAVSLAALPDTVGVGHSIALTASGLDPSGRDDDVTLAWSVTGSAGTVGSSAGGTVLFQCASAGSASVTVRAAMADGGDSCPETGTLTAVLRCTAP